MKSEAKEDSRINLNDLLKKAQERKREENKTNILIVSLVAFAAVIVLLVLSI
mgnify:CR=1 FL=1|tara:strand:- start:49 stop:204 length:156 start_codon:yes stop_codon:yes gene_type:complete